jgi:hypothetical protein
MKLQKQNKNRINRTLKKRVKKSDPSINWKIMKLIRQKGLGKFDMYAGFKKRK